MKRIVKISILLAMLVSAASYASVVGDTFCHTTLVKMDREKEDVKRPPKRHRAPSLPIDCIISAEGGVEIAGYSGDIISYEICDAATEAVLAVFSDESGFVSHLLTLSGEYLVRFETPDYIFAGYIYL